jgi:hypothetical protein
MYMMCNLVRRGVDSNPTLVNHTAFRIALFLIYASLELQWSWCFFLTPFLSPYILFNQRIVISTGMYTRLCAIEPVNVVSCKQTHAISLVSII